MKHNVMAFIHLEEPETELRALTAFRPIATIPMAGRYRVIDFILSNLVNAGIRQVGIFSQKNTRSLVDHVSGGHPWDLDLKHSGLFLFDRPLLSPMDDAKVFGNNMEFLKRSEVNYVLVCSSYMLCNMDFTALIEAHCASGCDITAVYHPTRHAYREFLNCGCLQLDDVGMVTGVNKNIGADSSANICMELFLMSKELLIRLLYQAARAGVTASLADFLMQRLASVRTIGFPFTGYTACINSTSAYYRANLELLDPRVRNELFCPERPIYTKIKDTPPSLYLAGSHVSDSVIADGCRIGGTVSHSILSRFVSQAPDSQIRDSIILQGAVISPGVQLSHAIIEKNVIVHPGTVISGTPDFPVVMERKTDASLFRAV